MRLIFLLIITNKNVLHIVDMLLDTKQIMQ